MDIGLKVVIQSNDGRNTVGYISSEVDTMGYCKVTVPTQGVTTSPVAHIHKSQIVPL